MKHIFRLVGLSALIGACDLPLGGCQNENEAGIATGTEGTSDPKYAKDDPATYRAFAKDHSQPKVDEKVKKSGARKH